VSWTGAADTPLSVRIAALAPALHPSERRVAEAILSDIEGLVECTAQLFADAVGVGRASVIRTARTLGYDGYPQLRVAAARELALIPSATAEPGDGTAIGTLRAGIDAFARSLPRVIAALDERSVADFVAALDKADRVVIAARGLSMPLGLDVAMRLGSVGRSAEFLPDPFAQQIAAGQLTAGCVCLALSGSGTSRSTLAAASAARTAGAYVLALTSFANAPLVALADTALVVPPVTGMFRDELLHPSRAALGLVMEQLTELLVARRGTSPQARQAVLAVLADSLDD
jgi:DNA-binding MurR/RpiR family transcriptional regulator